MTQILGHNYIGGQRSAAGNVQLQSVDANTGEQLPYDFIQATEAEVDAAELRAFFASLFDKPENGLLIAEQSAEARHLFDEQLTPVCAPGFLTGLHAPQDLQQQVLLPPLVPRARSMVAPQ